MMLKYINISICFLILYLLVSSCLLGKKLVVIEDANFCQNQIDIFNALLSNDGVLDRYGSTFVREKIFINNEIAKGIPHNFLFNDTVVNIIENSINREVEVVEENYISKCFSTSTSIGQSDYQVYYWYDENTHLMAIGTLLTLKEPGFNEGFILLYDVKSSPRLIDESFWIE